MKESKLNDEKEFVNQVGSMIVQHPNYKCKFCGNETFTFKDTFSFPVHKLTLYCSNKECSASLTFDAEFKIGMICIPSKRCPCGIGLLQPTDKFCGNCGRKNELFPKYNRSMDLKKESIIKDIKTDESFIKKWTEQLKRTKNKDRRAPLEFQIKNIKEHMNRRKKALEELKPIFRGD